MFKKLALAAAVAFGFASAPQAHDWMKPHVHIGENNIIGAAFFCMTEGPLLVARMIAEREGAQAAGQYLYRNSDQCVFGTAPVFAKEIIDTVKTKDGKTLTFVNVVVGIDKPEPLDVYMVTAMPVFPEKEAALGQTERNTTVSGG